MLGGPVACFQVPEGTNVCGVLHHVLAYALADAIPDIITGAVAAGRESSHTIGAARAAHTLVSRGACKIVA